MCMTFFFLMKCHEISFVFAKSVYINLTENSEIIPYLKVEKLKNLKAEKLKIGQLKTL